MLNFPVKGAINSIAAYEGKTAPAIEDELGDQIGVAGSTIQRYKAGYLPTEPRAIQIMAEAAVRRGYLSRAWLLRFLQAVRHPNHDAPAERYPVMLNEGKHLAVFRCDSMEMFPFVQYDKVFHRLSRANSMSC